MADSYLSRQPGIDSDALFLQLARIRRRLFVNRLLRNAACDLSIALLIFCALLLAERIFVLGVDVRWLLASCAAAAVVSPVLRTWLWGRVSSMHAAEVADTQLGLKERISTAVYLDEIGRAGVPATAAPALSSPSPSRPSPSSPSASRDGSLNEEWGALIVQDGIDRLRGVDVGQKFPVRPPRSAWWVFVVLLLPLATYYLVPKIDILGYGEERQVLAEEAKEADRQMEALDEKLDELSEDAKRQDLPEMKKLLEAMKAQAKLASEAQKPPEKKGDGAKNSAKKNALVELARREEMIKQASSAEKFKKIEKAIENMNKKSALADFKLTRKLRQALKRGDFKKAMKELDKLDRRMKELARLSRDPKSKKQLSAMRSQLSREMSQLSMDSKMLGDLSKSLSQLSSNLKSSNFQQSKSGMQMTKQQLQNLMKQMQKLQMMKSALNLVKGTKQSLAKNQKMAQKPHKCPNCGKPKALSNPWKKPPPGGT